MKTLRKCTCIGRVVRDEILVTKYMFDLTCPRARDLTQRTRGDSGAFRCLVWPACAPANEGSRGTSSYALCRGDARSHEAYHKAAVAS